MNEDVLHNEVITNKSTQNKPPEIAFRRFPKEIKLAILNDYLVYLHESDYDLGIDDDSVSFLYAIESVNSEK